MTAPLEWLRERLSLEFEDAALGPSGACVYDLDNDRSVFTHRHHEPRVMASTVKLFTFGAVLEAFGAEGTLTTQVATTGDVGTDGVLDGDLYVVGGGDPTVGSRRHVRHRYEGNGTTTAAIAEEIRRAGIVGVRGNVIADGSRFDSHPEPTGRLGALACNRKRVGQPSLYTAQQLTNALRAQDVVIEGAPAEGVTPPTAQTVATVDSPTIGTMVTMANKQSDNFVAEMLTRALAAADGAQGTTGSGAQCIMAFADRFGAGLELVNGSGLTSGNRCTPHAVLQYLRGIRDTPLYEPLFASLAVAGRDGTLTERMRNTGAQGNCWAKTGTLPSRKDTRISALSGYCRHPGGPTLAFSMMMERAESSYAMLAAQDRAVNAMVAYSATRAAQAQAENGRGVAHHGQI